MDIIKDHRLQQREVVAAIAGEIRLAETVGTLSQIGERLPALQLQLIRADVSALDLGAAMSSLTDSFTIRLLELAEDTYGVPPVAYVWMAGGSQGRWEQTLPSDQDNALLLDDSLRPEHDEYFLALSRFVCDGLNACGYEHCPGNSMATNADWRKPLRVWKLYFSDWIENPEKKALMLASIFFDLRPIFGASGLFDQLRQQTLAMTKRDSIFIAYMASNALSHRPPLGFFRQFTLIHDGQHDSSLDIKHRGIVPIVDIARVLALSEGLGEVNTTERLHAAYNLGALGQEMGFGLSEALEHLSRVRLEHQADQIERGGSADNYILPGSMTREACSRLEHSFRVIKSMQQVLAARHQVRLLG